MGLLLPLLALAGTAAGTGLNMAGNAQAERSMNNTVQDELSRQQQFQKKSSDTFNTNVSQNAGAGNAQQQMQQGSGAAMNLYKALQAGQTGGGASGLTALSPQEQALAGGRTGQQNQASGDLQGVGSWMTNQQLGNQRAQDQLGVTSRESAADASTLPTLLQGASHAGDSLNGLGGILSSLGMLSGLGAGLTGASLGSTAASSIGPVGSSLYNPRPIGPMDFPELQPQIPSMFQLPSTLQ